MNITQSQYHVTHFQLVQDFVNVYSHGYHLSIFTCATETGYVKHKTVIHNIAVECSTLEMHMPVLCSCHTVTIPFEFKGNRRVLYTPNKMQGIYASIGRMEWGQTSDSSYDQGQISPEAKYHL